MNPGHHQQSGMSLVEIVVAIVIMAIMSVGVLTFITNSASSYSRAATSNQLSSAGRVVIDRISMELHNALPESVRISTPLTSMDEDDGLGIAGDQCLEFVPVIAATTYIDPAFRPAAPKDSFNVVDFVPGKEGYTGRYAAIYPTSSSQIYSADLDGGGGSVTAAIARVDIVAGPMSIPNSDTIVYSRLSNDGAYDHRFLRQSSVDRLFLADAPVSFCISGNKLFRYSNYGFTAQQMLPLEPGGDCTAGMDACLPASTPDRVLISSELDNSMLTGPGGRAFDQVGASRHRNAVIQLELNFSQGGQEVRLNHEVLLPITP